MKAKFWAFVGSFGFLLATLYGHGWWPSGCVELQGSGWAASPCSTPGAIPSSDVVDSGETGAKGAGAQLSPDRIKALWIQHGGSPAEAHTAQAVARAESNGRPQAINTSNTNGTIDRGLFQVNSVHGGCSTFDLDENVRCAVEIQGTVRGWRHWTTYNSGAYRKYL